MLITNSWYSQTNTKLIGQKEHQSHSHAEKHGANNLQSKNISDYELTLQNKAQTRRDREEKKLRYNGRESKICRSSCCQKFDWIENSLYWTEKNFKNASSSHCYMFRINILMNRFWWLIKSFIFLVFFSYQQFGSWCAPTLHAGKRLSSSSANI